MFMPKQLYNFKCNHKHVKMATKQCCQKCYNWYYWKQHPDKNVKWNEAHKDFIIAYQKNYQKKYREKQKLLLLPLRKNKISS